MKITYYGTAAGEGFPALFCTCPTCLRAKAAGGRNIKTRSQSMINDDLLIDFPSDTMLHKILYGMDLTHVKTLLFTHAHGDHCVAVDLESMQEYAAHGRNIVMDIYGNENVLQTIRNAGLTEDRWEKLQFRFTVIENFAAVESNGYRITALPANHDKRQRCLIYLIEKDGKTLLYGHDTGRFLQETLDYLTAQKVRADLVSLDITSGVLDESGYHMGLPQAAKQKEELCRLGIADGNTVFVLNHLSHNSGGVIHDELEKLAKPLGFLLSYDGMELEF